MRHRAGPDTTSPEPEGGARNHADCGRAAHTGTQDNYDRAL